MFFRLSTFWLVVVLFVIVVGAVAAGMVIGRWIRSRPDAHRESVGVVQGTLLGLVGLLLAFGLTMAVGRYEARRALVVQEANDIGTTYLRAQLLAEPSRTTSLDAPRALRRRRDRSRRSGAGHAAASTTTSLEIAGIQRELWAAAGDAVRADPPGTAPRLYVETLNSMIDTHTNRVSSLRNRVPEHGGAPPGGGQRRRPRRALALPGPVGSGGDHLARRRRHRHPDPLHLVRPRPSTAGLHHRARPPVDARASMEQPPAAGP